MLYREYIINTLTCAFNQSQVIKRATCRSNFLAYWTGHIIKSFLDSKLKSKRKKNVLLTQGRNATQKKRRESNSEFHRLQFSLSSTCFERDCFGYKKGETLIDTSYLRKADSQITSKDTSYHFSNVFLSIPPSRRHVPFDSK